MTELDKAKKRIAELEAQVSRLSKLPTNKDYLTLQATKVKLRSKNVTLQCPDCGKPIAPGKGKGK